MERIAFLLLSSVLPLACAAGATKHSDTANPLPDAASADAGSTTPGTGGGMTSADDGGDAGPTEDASTPPPSSTTLTVTSPASGATLSGIVTFAGQAGSEWVNVAAYDTGDGGAKVGLDVTPTSGSYAISVDTTQLADGPTTISVMGFSVPAGQTGGTSAVVAVAVTIQNQSQGCATVTCSGHGTCGAPTGVPECACDSGYYAAGTTCISGASCLSIVDCGAVPDGGDSTAAIQSCLNMGQSEGKPVCVPAGVYSVGALTMNGGTLVGQGDSSELFGPNANTFGITVTGDSATVASLKLDTVGIARGLPNAVSLQSASHFLIDNVTVDGANGVGLYTDASGAGTQPSGPGRTTNNRVSNTLADAIHYDHASHDIYVAGNTVNTAGDDMIAIVSYQADGQGFTADTNFLVELNSLTNTPARGITVVGGNNVTIRNNGISQSGYSGIYVSSESSYSTWGVDNVLVTGNTIDHPAQVPNTGHAGLFSYSDTSYVVENVLYMNNVVTNDGNGEGQFAYGNVSNIFSTGNTLDGKALSGNGMSSPSPAQIASVTGSTVTP